MNRKNFFIIFCIASIVCVIIPTKSYSQEWFAENSEHVYSYGGMIGYGFETIRYSHDTIINDDEWKVLQSSILAYSFIDLDTSIFFNPVRHIIKSKNDKHYIYHDETELLAFDFTLNPGDTIAYSIYDSGYFLCAERNLYILDSVNVEFIADKNRRVQYFTVIDSTIGSWNTGSPDAVSYNTKIIEGIGVPEKHLVPQFSHSCNSDPVVYSFCSAVLEGNPYNPNNWDCTIEIINSTQNLIEEDLLIYPNPNGGLFYLNKINPKEYEIRIYSKIGESIPFTIQGNIITILNGYKGMAILEGITNDAYFKNKIIIH